MFFEDFDNALKVTNVRIFHASTKGEISNGRSRPFNTLSFRIAGGCTVFEGDREIDVVAGDMLFMPADTAFRQRSRYERIIVIHFESEKPFPKKLEVIKPDDLKVMRELFENAYHTWALRLPGYQHKTMSIFYKILEKLTASKNATNATYAYQSILPAVERMQARFNEPSLQISDLCKLVNLSDTQFRKHFVAVFGITPMKYLLKLRMEHACELLDDSPMNIEGVAHNSGFNDAKHFSTVFKKTYKISPLKYRKTDRGKQE